MLLEKLCEYSHRIESTPAMYIETPIRWLIDLDATGKLIGFVRTEGTGVRKDRGKVFLAPHIGRSSAVRAKLLADNGEYVLSVAREKSKKGRVAECHRAFLEQVKACAAATGEPDVRAVVHFLQTFDAARATLPEDFDAAGVLTFRVKGRLPFDLAAVRKFWASAAGAGEKSRPKPGARAGAGQMQCLICGQVRPAVKRLAFKIKGIPGGQKGGVALISANTPAFESYGLEASLIAPTCADCGERFSKAANALIQGQDTRIRVGPLVYLFWTKEASTFHPAALLSHPEPDDVRALIDSVFRGADAAAAFDPAPFYAAALGAAGGRAVVRDWLDTTVGRARRNLARYFALQRMVDRNGEEGAPLGLYALSASTLASTVRDVSKELAPNAPRALLHMALSGGPLPRWLLFQAVKRNRAEQTITRSRAALIKMVLLSQQIKEKEEKNMPELVQLNLDNRDPGYLCGRLLAVLEAVQRAALPGINATITDRFFGTASSAPASVFGRLIRGAQPHLSKLRRNRRGTYVALDTRLQDVLANLKEFPKILSLEGQGLFGLGYYHQRAADRAAAMAHKQARENVAAAEAAAGPDS
jgi:CRISPR-associated protein Csd1